jgi:DNA polymerase III epsilon subunit-like protein
MASSCGHNTAFDAMEHDFDMILGDSRSESRKWDVILVAHNAYAFDLMNMITELNGSVIEGLQFDPSSRSALTWFKESVAFVDSMEVFQKELSSTDVQLPNMTLDSLYAYFVGGQQQQQQASPSAAVAIPGRHDALEDAKALYDILKHAALDSASLLSRFAMPRGWADLEVIHRAWSVREALMKNPARPSAVPRIFAVSAPPPQMQQQQQQQQQRHQLSSFSPVPPAVNKNFNLSSFMSSRLAVTTGSPSSPPPPPPPPVWMGTISKDADKTYYKANLKRQQDGATLYDIDGRVEGRFLGLPGRLRAWCHVLRCLRSPHNNNNNNNNNNNSNESPYSNGTLLSSPYISVTPTSPYGSRTPSEGIQIPFEGVVLRLMDPSASWIAQQLHPATITTTTTTTTTALCSNNDPLQHHQTQLSNPNTRDALTELQRVCSNVEKLGAKVVWAETEAATTPI